MMPGPGYYKDKVCECGKTYSPITGSQKWCMECGEAHKTLRSINSFGKNRERYFRDNKWDVDDIPWAKE